MGIKQRALPWVLASRPFSLTASVAPVLVGSALAFRAGGFDVVRFLLVLVGSVLVQVGTNLVDEYADHLRPAGEHKLPAPYKVIARGMLSPGEVRAGALAAFGLAALIGLYLVLTTGWPLLALCLASLGAAYFYAGGPRPLGDLGLGWPLVFVFMGPVMVAGSYYALTGRFSAEGWLFGVPVGCLVTAILAANDLRDFEEDLAAGRTTPVVRFGLKFGRLAWTFLVGGAFICLAILAFSFGPALLLPLTAAVPAVQTARQVWSARTRPERAAVLPRTAVLHGWLGLLTAAGLAAGGA
jgi:1,4-dihydroxy-2-naphthoate octaprenyltransferase